MTPRRPPSWAGGGRRRQGEGQGAGLLQPGCPSVGTAGQSSDGRRVVRAVPRKERSGHSAVAAGMGLGGCGFEAWLVDGGQERQKGGKDC